MEATIIAIFSIIVSVIALLFNLIQSFLTLSIKESISKNVKALIWLRKLTGQEAHDRNKPTSVIGVMLSRKAKNFGIAYLLLSAALVLQVVFQPANATVAILIFIIAISFFINQQTTQYRIKKGFYGSSENEAAEIIEFILAHSKDEDFPKGGGKAEIFPREEVKEFTESLEGFQEA